MTFRPRFLFKTADHIPKEELEIMLWSHMLMANKSTIGEDPSAKVKFLAPAKFSLHQLISSEKTKKSQSIPLNFDIADT